MERYDENIINYLKVTYPAVAQLIIYGVDPKQWYDYYCELSLLSNNQSITEIGNGMYKLN